MSLDQSNDGRGKRKRRMDKNQDIDQEAGDSYFDDQIAGGSKRIKFEHGVSNLDGLKPRDPKLEALKDRAVFVGLTYRYTYSGTKRTRAIEKFALESYLDLNADTMSLIMLIDHTSRHFEGCDLDDFTRYLDSIEFYDRCVIQQKETVKPPRAAAKELHATSIMGTDSLYTADLKIEYPHEKFAGLSAGPAPKAVGTEQAEPGISGAQNGNEPEKKVSKVTRIKRISHFKPRRVPIQASKTQGVVMPDVSALAKDGNASIVRPEVPQEARTGNRNQPTPSQKPKPATKKLQHMKRLQKKKPPTVLRPMPNKRPLAPQRKKAASTGP
ncbi:hypothetical protein SUNI508_00225 [Seiridium unicorne]|uniref:Uncharacterized protein n=1 Tax=Seiridium unicorne TaxID=138068 RepID=A0ABR2VID6_9PEZI